jgi:DNA-binding transcriptional MerR regulator
VRVHESTGPPRYLQSGLRTGELAARAGVNIQTLRYYERLRLLAPPVRRPSGQRAYPESAVALLRCIKGAQRLGFTLTEIQDLLAVAAHRRGTDELHRRAQAKIAEIDARIADLEQIRHNLEAVLAARCESLTECSCGLAAGLPLGDSPRKEASTC